MEYLYDYNKHYKVTIYYDYNAEKDKYIIKEITCTNAPYQYILPITLISSKIALEYSSEKELIETASKFANEYIDEKL